MSHLRFTYNNMNSWTSPVEENMFHLHQPQSTDSSFAFLSNPYGLLSPQSTFNTLLYHLPSVHCFVTNCTYSFDWPCRFNLQRWHSWQTDTDFAFLSSRIHMHWHGLLLYSNPPWGLLWKPQIPFGVERDWGGNELISSPIPFNPDGDLSLKTSPEGNMTFGQYYLHSCGPHESISLATVHLYLSSKFLWIL